MEGINFTPKGLAKACALLSTLLLVACGGGSSPTAPAPGTLDTSFATNGIAQYDSGDSERGWSLATDASGRILITGAMGTGLARDMILLRYLPDGTLDASFGTNGTVTYDGGSTDEGYSVTVSKDGKIIVAGSVHNGTDMDLAVWRFNSDGSPDTTFGSNGVMTWDNGSTETGLALALDASARIVVGGETYNGTDYDLTLWRLTNDGSLDSTFDTDGVVIYDGGNYDRCGSIAIDGNGKIVIAGGTSIPPNPYDGIVLRYNENGSLDTSFDTDGIFLYNGGADDRFSGVAIDVSNRILPLGTSVNTGNDLIILRLDNNGLDTTFGTNGIVTYDGGSKDSPSAAVFDTKGRLLVVGYSSDGTNDNMTLWRFDGNGNLDTSFGSNGLVSHTGNGSSDGSGIALTTGGKILVTGSGWNGTDGDLLVWRFNP